MKGGEGNEPKKTGARSFLQPRWLRYIQKSLAPHEDSESGSSGCVVLMSLGLHTGDVESRFHICFSQDEPQRELTGSLFLVYIEYAIGIFFLCVPSGARPFHTTEI